MTYSEQKDTWSIKAKFKKGGIKFTSSYATYLTWGKDKNMDNMLKFWGEEIPVEEGVHTVVLDLSSMKYKLLKE